MIPSGLHEVFEQNRESLLRYLRAHGAGDDAEDLMQDLWLKLSAAPAGPVGAPRNYLFRAATNLMIDRRRSESQARRRDGEWSVAADRLSGTAAVDPDPERIVHSQRQLAGIQRELAKLPPRALSIFREHRLEGRTQREIAQSMGLSQSTIESDLRLVYRQLDDLRRRLDEA